MSESTLATDYDELRAEAADIGDQGRDSSTWDSDTTTRLAAVLRRAHRKAYWPAGGHRWNFLTPTTSLTLWRTITGTISSAVHSGGLTTVTATTAVFQPSLDTSHVLIDDSTDNEYAFYSYTSTTVIVVSGDASAETDTFAIAGNDTYRAPDNFGRLLDRMWFDGSQGQERMWIEQRSADQIEQYRSDGLSGFPRYVALVPVLNSVGQQRWNFMFYPEPDAAYVLRYRYTVLPDVVTSSSPYPYGPPWFADLLVTAVRSEAELEFRREYGQHEAAFQAKVLAAIVQDRSTGPTTLGPMESPRAHDLPRISWQQSATLNY